MTKKIMSIAAIAAIFTTGANAFDATQGDGILMKETSATAAVKSTYRGENNVTMSTLRAISSAKPGELGDALIYPAFFSNNGFSTDFSVINTSSTEAVVAKVVLYSAVNSNELRDFNIYLSANDVFRATIKDGKITSTDGSTVVVGSDSATKITDHGFVYKDSSSMASSTTPFSTDVNEAIGYIGVFGMVQVDQNTTTNSNIHTSSAKLDAKYHKKHNELWRDYRHLVDQCRSENWRSGIDHGIYTGTTVNIPNIDTNASKILATKNTLGLGSDHNCTTLRDSAQTTDTTLRQVHFKGVEPVLTGSLTVIGNDSRGTRAMTIKPVPYTNFSDRNNTVIWTEGELATIFDRCIETNTTNTIADYNDTCVQADANSATITKTLYEFGSAESKLLVTQPWKRVSVQMYGDGNTVNTAAKAYSGITRQTTANGIASGTDVKDFNVKDYGGFKITQTVYNDDEDNYVGSSGGFTVSPASTAAADTIANEMAMFDPLPGGANYPKGYAVVNFSSADQHGIVTQMTAISVNGTAEINWLYPLSNY